VKILGFVPARMASSRFPGKPLFPICGRPMVEHVFERANMFEQWDGLFVATCDPEIREFAEAKEYRVVMTKDTHTRALDRVAEAAEKCGLGVEDDDIVVCVQGDEPMMRADMITAVTQPLIDDSSIPGTVLGMEIVDDEVFRNPDTVKIVHNIAGDVLYTSRAPIPYCEKLTPEIGARRIYGILAFRWHFLKWFNSQPETNLELLESCDSNRICDLSGGQRVAPYAYIPSFSVDSPADRDKVEEAMKQDPVWGSY
jgi:3-deoxy-manno-octulosonate cytidylyltransferase (CMP-KDO synthetase)